MILIVINGRPQYKYVEGKKSDLFLTWLAKNLDDKNAKKGIVEIFEEKAKKLVRLKKDVPSYKLK